MSTESDDQRVWPTKDMLTKLKIIFKSKPGEISERAQWCCSHKCWFYNADTHLGLLYVMVTEWKSDRHLVG